MARATLELLERRHAHLQQHLHKLRTAHPEARTSSAGRSGSHTRGDEGGASAVAATEVEVSQRPRLFCVFVCARVERREGGLIACRLL